MTAPPRLAEWLLRLVIGRAGADNVLGDLSEQLSERIGGGAGGFADRLWYWLEVVSLLRPRTVRALRQWPGPRRSSRRQGGVQVLIQDLRFAARAIRTSPGFALMTILTLAFGIAGTTTVFSAVDGFVLRPFPFPDQRTLITVGSAHPKIGAELNFFEHMSGPEYADIENSRLLERAAAFDLGNRQLTVGDLTENLFTGFWWGDPFATIGMAPFMGRGFTSAEVDAADRVAVVSHRVWRDRFGADPNLVGGKVLVNGEPYLVVGIMPPKALVYGTDLWLPMFGQPATFPRNRRFLQILARLAPGATMEALAAELGVIAGRTEAEYGAAMPEYLGWKLVPRTWADANAETLKPAALAMVGAIAFVMLLVCTNVATLLLGRSAARRREIALRSALGAGRARIFRQLVTESLLLALLGAAVGIGLGHLGILGVNRVLASLPVSVFDPLTLNPGVLAATTVVAILAGLGFGSIPAVHLLSSDLRTAIQSGSVVGGTRSRLGLQRTLIAVEAALAVTLLAGSGYLLRSFAFLRAVEPGFAPENVLTMRLTLARERYSAEAVEPFFSTVRERIEALPGVTAVASASQFPPMLFGRSEFQLEGQPVAAEGTRPFAYETIASPEYFSTLGVPLKAGRLFTDTDRPGGIRVLVVNDVLARKYFPGRDPIGSRIRIQAAGRDTAWAEIVGVVGATRNRGLDTDPAPEIFISSRQTRGANNQMFLLVRAGGNPRLLLGQVRAAIRALDPDQPVYAVRTIEETYQQGQLARRLSVVIFTLFGGFALSLAVVGLYGVVSFSTAQRAREIGVRVALGAGRSSVAGVFVRQAMVPVLAGTAIGLGAAWAIGRMMAALLFRVQAGDWVTLLGAAATLIGAGLVASYLPAARASRLDPVTTLRQD